MTSNRYTLACFLCVISILGCGKSKTTMGPKPGPAADVTAPVAVQNLTAVVVDTSSIRLTWTAPGDDGTSGSASRYDLRRAGSSATAWDQMTLLAGEPRPAASGQTESFTATGLTPGSAYYFRLKAADEIPNWSAASNLASATTASPSPSPFQWTSDFATDRYPLAVAIGDLNADGRLDIVTANHVSFATGGFGSVSVLLGNGSGTFGARTDYRTPTSPTSVAIADLSSDGIPDVVVPASANPSSVSLIYGNGDGTLQDKRDWLSGDGPSEVAFGDFNRDGKLDIAAGDAGQVAPGDKFTVSILIAYFNPKVLYPTDRQPLGIASGDLNHDGFLDLVTVGYQIPNEFTVFSSAASVLLGRGDGTFTAPTSFSIADYPWAVKLADLNGDGTLDLLSACTSSSSVSVLLGNGDGTFGAHRDFQVREGTGSLCVADFNRDGRIDVATTGSAWISVLLGQGDGTFAPSIDMASASGTPGEGQITTADLNGDGWPDLAVAHNFLDTVGVFLNTGRW